MKKRTAIDRDHKERRDRDLARRLGLPGANAALTSEMRRRIRRAQEQTPTTPAEHACANQFD